MNAARAEDDEIGARLVGRLLAVPYGLGGIVSALAIYVLYFLVAEWSYTFVLPPSSSAVFWLPSGITFAAFVRSRRHHGIWPYWVVALFLAQWTVVRMHDVPEPTGAVWSLANAILPVTAGLIARKFVAGPLDFRRLGDVFGFIGIALASAVPSGMVAAAGTVAGFGDADLLDSAIAWAASDALGILLAAPVVLSWTARPLPAAGRRREGALLFASLAAFSAAILYHSRTSDASLERPYFSFLIFFAAWAAIRFSPRGTSLVLLAIDLVGAWATIKGFGAGEGDSGARLFTLQLLVANIGLLMLLLAAAIEEQRTARLGAEEALKLRDDFLMVASHELKTPLTSLTLQVQVLNESIALGRLQELPRDALLDLARVSDLQIRRFAQLINDLFDVTRIRAGRLLLRLERLELAPLLRDTANRFRVELERSGSAIALEAEEGIFGRWDRTRLEQVVGNLLSNAIKYGAGKPIAIEARRAGGRAVLVVRDHGIGISAEDHRRVFERFERAVPVKQFGGLGLGLFIARQVAEAHGGSIRVESERARGASFIVELPLEP